MHHATIPTECICVDAKLRLFQSDPRFTQQWRHSQMQRALLCCRVELIYIYPQHAGYNIHMLLPPYPGAGKKGHFRRGVIL